MIEERPFVGCEFPGLLDGFGQPVRGIGGRLLVEEARLDGRGQLPLEFPLIVCD
jgi:hypothetical protein